MGSEQSRSSVQQALTWLIHPVSLLAIAAMILNDHVLKQQFGTWWTGKLSDVAGLIFFPALVAVVLAAVAPRLAPRTVAISAIAVTGVGFAWAKAADAGAATASDVLSALAGPSVVLKDATDLLALPALAVAWWVAERATGEIRGAARRAAVAIVLPVAVLGSVATSSAGTDIATQFAVNDGVTYVGVANDEWCAPDNGDCEIWYVLKDGWWADAPQNAPLTRPGDVQRCSPDDSNVCYRAADAGIGVLATDDGGETWREEWSLTDEQVVPIAASQGAAASLARTYDVVVVATSDGYEVWAANGIDGLAVRHTDGTWERLGWTVVGNPDYAPTAVPPTEIIPGSPLDPTAPWSEVPWMWAWSGPLIAACAWLILAGAQKALVPRWRALTGAAIAGTLMTLFTWRFTDVRFDGGEWFIIPLDMFVHALLAAICALIVVVCAAITGSVRSAGWYHATFFWVGAVLAVLLLGPLVRNDVRIQFALSAGVSVAATVPLWWLAKRRSKRPPPTVEEPPSVLPPPSVEPQQSQIGILPPSE